MEVVNATRAYMSNYEVMIYLRDIRENLKKGSNQSQLPTITYETVLYLENTACKHQSRESVLGYMKELSRYNLSKKEKLALLNAPPVTALELQFTIEDFEERVNEQQTEEILTLTTKYFPNLEETKESDNNRKQ